MFWGLLLRFDRPSRRCTGNCCFIALGSGMPDPCSYAYVVFSARNLSNLPSYPLPSYLEGPRWSLVAGQAFWFAAIANEPDLGEEGCQSESTKLRPLIRDVKSEHALLQIHMEVETGAAYHYYPLYTGSSISFHVNLGEGKP